VSSLVIDMRWDELVVACFVCWQRFWSRECCVLVNVPAVTARRGTACRLVTHVVRLVPCPALWIREICVVDLDAKTITMPPLHVSLNPPFVLFNCGRVPARWS
jgi:hypothetical protein